MPNSTNMIWFNTTGATTSSTPTPMFYMTGANGATTATTNTTWPTDQQVMVRVPYVPDHIVLGLGHSKQIDFPDGTIIYYNPDGSFEIKDENSKVIYKANRSHDFNPFINASDKLEDFIRYCGDVGVRQGDMLGIPIRHFVQWLVIEAAKADGEEANEILQLPNYSKPRCRSCKRFMSPKLKADGIEFCRPRCLEIKLNNHKGVKRCPNINRIPTPLTASVT